jgi:hypothetical protein
MAPAAKENATISPAVGNRPASIDDHQADKALRYEEQQRQRSKVLRCLDPLTAAEYEKNKPLYEWRIQCGIFRPARGRQRAGEEKFDDQVVAQTEADAWAMFCDKIGEYPSRRDCRPTITQLQKRSFGADD